MNRSATPPAANTSASPTVATVSPTAPRSSWRRAISGHLWVFACGRRARPFARASAAVRSRFRWSTSRSTARYGVSMVVSEVHRPNGAPHSRPGARPDERHLAEAAQPEGHRGLDVEARGGDPLGDGAVVAHPRGHPPVDPAVAAAV